MWLPAHSRGNNSSFIRPRRALGAGRNPIFIYFKDPNILPRHAVINISGARVMLQATGSGALGGATRAQPRTSGWRLVAAWAVRLSLQGEASVMTAVVCPYCRTNIGAEDGAMVCEGCGTAHHADCYAENGGCTIFGCSKAPGDEPKLSVSTPELVAVAAPAARTGASLAASASTRRYSATSNDARSAARGQSSCAVDVRRFRGEDTSATAEEAVVHEPKKRTSYILLGALLGAFGAHNFYAGYYKKAGIQLAITLLTLGFGSPMSWLWAVIDICTIDRDVRGVQFES